MRPELSEIVSDSPVTMMRAGFRRLGICTQSQFPLINWDTQATRLVATRHLGGALVVWEPPQMDLDELPTTPEERSRHISLLLRRSNSPPSDGPSTVKLLVQIHPAPGTRWVQDVEGLRAELRAFTESLVRCSTSGVIPSVTVIVEEESRSTKVHVI